MSSLTADAQKQLSDHIQRAYSSYQGTGIYTNWSDFSALVRDGAYGTKANHNQMERQLGAELQQVRALMEQYGASWQMYGLTPEQQEAFIQRAAERAAQKTSAPAPVSGSPGTSAATPRNSLAEGILNQEEDDMAMLHRVMRVPDSATSGTALDEPPVAQVHQLRPAASEASPAPSPAAQPPVVEGAQAPNPSVDIIAQKLELMMGALAVKSLGGLGLQGDEESDIKSLILAYPVEGGTSREEAIITALRFVLIPLMKQFGVMSIQIAPTIPQVTDKGVVQVPIDLGSQEQRALWWEMQNHFQGFNPTPAP